MARLGVQDVRDCRPKSVRKSNPTLEGNDRNACTALSLGGSPTYASVHVHPHFCIVA